MKTKKELTNVVQKLQSLIKKEIHPSSCFYYLGYLHTYATNKPIPNECWGCSNLLECIEHKPSADAEEDWKTTEKTTSSTKAKTKRKKTIRKKKR